MPVTNGYATVAQLRTHLGDDSAKLSTELLERALNATSRGIDVFCGRRFFQDASASARTYRVDEPYEVDVDDIATTTDLEIATDTTGDGTFDTTWDADDYVLEPENADADGGAYAWWRIVAIDTKTFPVPVDAAQLDTRGRLRRQPRRRRLQVTARWGWAEVPDQVEQACLLRAAALFKRREATWGVAGFGDFGVVRIRSDSDVAELLAPLRRMRMAVV